MNVLRHAIRSLLRRPALTTTAVVSLAIGIGANAALLGLVDGLGLRPLPIARPDRLVRVFGTHGAFVSDEFSYLDYRDIVGSAPAFEGIAAYGIRAVALTGRERSAEVVMIGIVTGNYFETVGVRARSGRVIGPPDDAPAGAQVAVVSERLWRERYGEDRPAPGRMIELNGRPFAVVGVLPADFNGLDPILAPDVWVPAAAWPSLNSSRGEFADRGNRWLRVVGRLRDGATIAEASAQITPVMSALARNYPVTNTGRGSRLVFDRDSRRRISRIAGSIFGLIGGFVVLLACANVAGLLLARAEERRHELAVRAAIGASRARLVRELLVESAALAALAAGAGIALAWWLIRLLPAAIPPAPVPLGLVFRLDARVTVFAVLLAALTVILFGLAPAMSGSRVDPGEILKASSAGGRGDRSRVRHLLVAGQIAVTFALVTTAVFLARSLWSLERVDAGFERRPMLLVTLSPSAVGYDEPRARAFYQALLARARALPGVERVALARRPPLGFSGGGAVEIVSVPGREPPAGERGFSLHFNVVAPGYFDTMGTRILRGRDFNDADTRTAPRVVIVSEELARRFWPDTNAVGQHIRIGPDSRTVCEIVGVARDGKYNRLAEAPDPYIYFPFSQRFAGEATVFLRAAGDERTLIAPLRHEIDALDRGVPALRIMTMTDHLRAATAVERVTASLVSALGLLGLFLAIVGLYGLVSYLVRRRTREIGIRMALGARPIDIAREVLRQAAVPIASGLGVGLALAVVVATLTAGSMYGVSAADAPTYAAAAAIVAAVTLVASLVPARRAALVDPSHALRRD
jgi:putative ABC transport system permease protein